MVTKMEGSFGLVRKLMLGFGIAGSLFVGSGCETGHTERDSAQYIGFEDGSGCRQWDTIKYKGNLYRVIFINPYGDKRDMFARDIRTGKMNLLRIEKPIRMKISKDGRKIMFGEKDGK